MWRVEPGSTLIPHTGSVRTICSLGRAGHRHLLERRRGELGPAAADRDQLGEDRHGDLLGRRGADVHPARRPQRGNALLGEPSSSSHARTAAARRTGNHPTYAAGRRSAAARASSSHWPWWRPRSSAARRVRSRRGRRAPTVTDGWSSATAEGSMSVERNPIAESRAARARRRSASCRRPRDRPSKVRSPRRPPSSRPSGRS